MKSFKAVFKQIFLQKVKYIHLVLLIQIITIILLALFSNKGREINAVVSEIGLTSTVIADLVITIILCWQNERINSSQTWQLIPLASSAKYIANVLSSVLGCIYIFIIQLLINFILLLPYLSASPVPININNLEYGVIHDYFQLCVSLFLLVLVIFTFVSFVNFLSYLIINILPTNTKWVRLLVTVVLTVVATYILGSTSTGSISDWLKPNVQYIIDILIFGGFDLWLINKYVESKVK